MDQKETISTPNAQVEPWTPYNVFSESGKRTLDFVVAYYDSELLSCGLAAAFPPINLGLKEG